MVPCLKIFIHREMVAQQRRKKTTQLTDSTNNNVYIIIYYYHNVRLNQICHETIIDQLYIMSRPIIIRHLRFHEII